MSERTRKRRDFIQNITIALLCVSAVLLFAQTQIYSLGVSGGLLSFLSENELPTSSANTGQSAASLTAPVRVAAASNFGRYGSVTLTNGAGNVVTVTVQQGNAVRVYTVTVTGAAG